MVLALLGLTMGGCGGKTTQLALATGGTAGVYYPLGGAMAEIFNQKVKNVNTTAQSSGASVANVRALEKGDFQLVLAQNDITYYAANGLEMFTEGKLTKLRGVATLYPEVIQLVTLADKGIYSVTDLRGKRVAVGAPGSGTEANARQILETFGINYNNLRKADFLSFGEAAANLKDGHIDAAFITAGLPTAAVQEIAATHSVRIVPIGGPEVDNLKAKYPFYTTTTVKAGTYRGQDYDVVTVAVKAMLLASADLPDDLVYNLTKALFENLDRMGAAHAQGKAISLTGATDGMPIPLHPGAKRYYDQKK
jgi:TRAP transporter TAXI family solute receptor